MNATCSPYTTTPLTQLNPRHFIITWAGTARAWWARWTASRLTRLTECELTTLDGLTAETLKDIGAPEWMQERALRDQERARQGGLFERDSLHWR